MQKTVNLLLVGVGGQGIILISDIISDAAISSSYDVKKTDTIGMSQRGGSVISNLKIADKVWSPLITEGNVDILLAFEKLEAARWGYYLRKNGIIIINDYAIPPLSVSIGNCYYPTNMEIEKTLQQRTTRIYFLPGSQKASNLGDARTFNIFLLGSISHLLPFTKNIWIDSITRRIPSKILEINIRAFELGKEETKKIFVA